MSSLCLLTLYTVKSNPTDMNVQWCFAWISPLAYLCIYSVFPTPGSL